jgi:hypothetical protein
MDLHKILTKEAEILKGGKGDNPSGSFKEWLSSKEGQAELAKGIKVESEHANDKRIAKEIATDHLKEDKKYYEKLEKAGLAESFMAVGTSSVGGNTGDAGSGIPILKIKKKPMRWENKRMELGRPTKGTITPDPATGGKSAFAKGAP